MPAALLPLSGICCKMPSGTLPPAGQADRTRQSRSYLKVDPFAFFSLRALPRTNLRALHIVLDIVPQRWPLMRRCTVVIVFICSSH